MSKKPAELTPTQKKRFEKCYAVYRKKAARGQDEITWAKYDFDDGMTEVMYQAIVAQNRADKGETNKKFLRSFSRWMNERGWMDEIESQQEKELKREPDKCKCGSIAKHKNGDCDLCLTLKLEKIPESVAYRNIQLTRQYFADNLVGLTTEQLREKARELARRIGK